MRRLVLTSSSGEWPTEEPASGSHEELLKVSVNWLYSVHGVSVSTAPGL